MLCGLVLRRSLRSLSTSSSVKAVSDSAVRGMSRLVKKGVGVVVEVHEEEGNSGDEQG